MSSLMASYRLSAAGFDALNGRLIDESGRNNHLPLLAGTPDFTGSYGGKLCFKMHGTAYFGGPNLVFPEVCTIITVLHPKVLNGEFMKYIWATGRVYPYNDPGHQNPSEPFDNDVSLSPNRYRALYGSINDVGGHFGNMFYGKDQTTGFVSDSWNVITDVWNGETNQVKKRFNAGAWGTAGDIAQHQQVLYTEEMRIGYRSTGLTVASNHLGALRMEIHAGDYTLDKPADYAAKLAAYMTTPEL